VARRRWTAAASTLVLLATLAGCGDATDPGADVPVPTPTSRMTATPGIVRAGICPPTNPRLPLPPARLEAFQEELLRRLGFKLALRIQASTLAGCERPATPLADRTIDLLVTAPGQDTAGQPGVLATEPYLVVQYALVVKEGSAAARDGLDALDDGTRVGVPGGTRGAAWAKDRLGARGVEVAGVPGEPAALAALARGRYHALILPRARADRAARTVPGLRVARMLDAGERASFLVAAANPALRGRVDRMLEEIIFDGSYAVIFHRHLAPTPVPIDFLPPD
jgi:hypothetical protein